MKTTFYYIAEIDGVKQEKEMTYDCRDIEEILETFEVFVGMYDEDDAEIIEFEGFYNDYFGYQSCTEAETTYEVYTEMEGDLIEIDSEF